MADNDSQIDLKKRARRRLVGSAALALAAAIVLPMVMDHEPRPPSQDVQIRIPSQEGSNFTSRVIAGKAPAPSQPVAGVIAEESTAPVVDEKPQSGRKPDLEQGSPVFKPGEELIPPPRKLDPPKAELVKPEPRKPEPKPEAKPEPKKPEPPKPDPKQKEKEQKEREREKAQAQAQAEAERAKALLAGASPKDEVAKPHVLSLGAYREAGNVAILRAKLKAEGYPSYTETVGDKVRVRAGPFPNKAAADKAAARIQKILGVQASVAAK
ncbi:SPOR domain-containing protein [Zoogloea sp.]|jgi:DedD protein|uniref:SPOR domain-containing protein n=1 Tax=Zoogloea sp. TaxID=49181 RepID=UPI0035B2F787